MLQCVYTHTLTEGFSDAAPTSWDLDHTACSPVCFCLPAASSATSPFRCILILHSVTKSPPSLSPLNLFRGCSFCRATAEFLFSACAAAHQCWSSALGSALAAAGPHVLMLSPTKRQTQSCSSRLVGTRQIRLHCSDLFYLLWRERNVREINNLTDRSQHTARHWGILK